MTNDLFDTEVEKIYIDMPDADVCLYDSFFPAKEANRLFDALLQETDWEQKEIKLYGKTHPLPRLTAWYGDPSKTYVYSGVRNVPKPWTPTLTKIKDRIESVSGVKFNSVLLNRYRSGSENVSWHSDDEPELGEDPVIGSVSLGQTRTFSMRHKKRQGNRFKKRLTLEHGSYLLMQGKTQDCWLHQVPKSKKEMGERINLTFRKIIGQPHISTIRKPPRMGIYDRILEGIFHARGIEGDERRQGEHIDALKPVAQRLFDGLPSE